MRALLGGQSSALHKSMNNEKPTVTRQVKRPKVEALDPDAAEVEALIKEMAIPKW